MAEAISVDGFLAAHIMGKSGMLGMLHPHAIAGDATEPHCKQEADKKFVFARVGAVAAGLMAAGNALFHEKTADA